MSGYSKHSVKVVVEPSCSIVSEYSPQQVSYLSSHSQLQGLTDRFSQDDVFSLMLQEVNELASKLQHLGRQYLQQSESCKTPQLRSFSRSYNEEYADILNNKGDFLDKLADAVEISDTSGIPKYKIHCYQEFSSMLINRCNEANQEIQQDKEQIKKIKNESEGLNKQLDIFSNQVDDHQESGASDQSNLLFTEAKHDLEKVLRVLYPKNEERKTLVSTMDVLIKAYMNHLDNSEEQYIEINPSIIKHNGMQSLMRGGLIIPHPHRSGMFRLYFVE